MSVDMLEGLVAIIPTPFLENGAVDEAGVRHLVRAAVDMGLDGVVVLGSNAEFPYLRFEEKLQVMAAAVEAAEHRIPVIGTASAWSTELAIELAHEARGIGCDAVMAALPLYFALDFDDAVAHFRSLAEHAGLPVFYYHFPDVTGLHASPEKLARIAEIDGVVGAKMTVIHRGFLRRTIEATRKFEWRVFTGTSLLLEDCLDFGGAGVFCPLPLIGTKDVRALWTAHRSGERTTAAGIQRRLLRSIPLFTGSSLPPWALRLGFQAVVRLPMRQGTRVFASQGMLKEALRLQGHPISHRVRRPYQELDARRAGLVKQLLDDLDWR